MAITLDGSTNNIAIGANATGPSYLRLYEDTDNGSHYIDVTAPSAFGTNRILTLPDATTTLVGTDASQTLTNKTLGSGLVMGVSAITSETAKAFNWNGSSSNTSIDFTGIPSWVKRITVVFNGLSTNGTALKLVRIGNSSIVSSGYSCGRAAIGTANAAGGNTTTGFPVGFSNLAADSISGIMTIANITGNTWVASFTGGCDSGNFGLIAGGNLALSGTLDRLQITTVNGTDTFDSGTVNILYE